MKTKAPAPWPPQNGQQVRVPKTRGTITVQASHGIVISFQHPYYTVEVRYGHTARRRLHYTIEKLQPAGSREPRIYEGY